MEIPDKPDYHARTCRPDGGCGEKRLASERTGGGNALSRSASGAQVGRLSTDDGIATSMLSRAEYVEV